MGKGRATLSKKRRGSPTGGCCRYGWHNRCRVEAQLGPLLPLFERERAAGNALALGVMVQTEGSTYRKPGALLLIAADGRYAGLLSGGCLEGDLAAHARRVIDTGTASLVRYDLRGEDDLLWGLGVGCEGAMQILLLRVGPEIAWQPLAHLATAFRSHSPAAFGVVVESSREGVPLGALVLPDETYATLPALRGAEVRAALAACITSGEVSFVGGPAADWRLFVAPLMLPARILLLGAGPDAAPVVDFATRLGWRVTLVDHRTAYAVPDHFPGAERVLALPATDRLTEALDLAPFDAVVVMSHHLNSDLAYLRALAHTPIPYIGLLGPVARRERLLHSLGADARLLRPRLHAPVGLALGGRSPESVALGIVAQIHAFVHGVIV
jgi:xanthine dehydrogenase accessory factor